MSATNWNLPPPPTYDDTTLTITSLTPYLQLSHLLSLTWLAYPILSLIFVAFRLQLSLDNAQKDIASAKNDIVAGCKAAQTAATAAASLPRYMALATNKQFADAVNDSMHGARSALILALTAMEAIVNFMIATYRSTFLCFLDLVVTGGLGLVIAAVEQLNGVLQGVASGLSTSIQASINGSNSAITSAINAINKVNPFSPITAPQIAVPSLASLQNVSLPSSFQQALTTLNASIPTVAAIKAAVEDFVDTPFELLKQEINDTFVGLSFNSSLLPVPDENRLTFCNNLDTSFVDDIGRDLIKAAQIGIIILILAALFLIGLNCVHVWWKWRCLKRHFRFTREAWTSDPTIVHTASSSSAAPQVTLSDHNLMMLKANSEHPLITRITHNLARRTGMTPSQHTKMRWFFHYVFHPPALACFLIGFFGLLSVEIQLLTLGPLLHIIEKTAEAAVDDFTDTITNAINLTMLNQSLFYANEINGKVDAVQSVIDNNVFGWVNASTTSLNTTINNFYYQVQNMVSSVFNGTVLEAPAHNFVQCIIGSKVTDIEKALTFLHDHLNVTISRVRSDILVLSPQAVNETTAPIAAAAVGGGSSNSQGILGRLLADYEDGLKKERLMFGVFIGIWGIVVFMAICVILWHSFGRPYLHSRGRRKWEGQRAGGMAIAQDLKYPVDDKREFRSFTPLPSPKGSAFKPFWASRSNSPETASPSSSVESVVQKDWEYPLPRPTTSLSAPQKRTAKLLAIGRKAMGRERLRKDSEEEETAPPVIIESSMEERHRNKPWYTKLMTRKGNQQTHVQEIKESDWDPYVNKEPEEPPKLQVYTEKGILDPHHQQEDETLPRSRWSSSPDATQTSWMRVMSPTKKPFIPAVVAPPLKIRQNVDNPFDDNPFDDDSVYEDSARPSYESPTPTMMMQPILPMPLYNGFDRSQTQTQPLSVRRNIPSPPRHPRRNQESPPPPPKSPRMYEPQNSLAPPPHHHRRPPSIRPRSQWRITNGVPSDYSGSSLDMDMEESLTPVTRLLTTTRGRHSSVNPFMTPFDDEHRVKIESNPADLRKSMRTSPFVVL